MISHDFIANITITTTNTTSTTITPIYIPPFTELHHCTATFH